MVYTLLFFSSKYSLFHNSNEFGSHIIHILYTGCAKIKKIYIYSTNIGTEYFKHGIYSSFIPLQKAVCFIILTCLVPVLFTFYIQGVLKLKKNYSGAKRLKMVYSFRFLPLQNAVCFIILKYLVPVLFTFYIHGVLKLNKIIPAPKGYKTTTCNIPAQRTLIGLLLVFKP
jgi:hypothetical protein